MTKNILIAEDNEINIKLMRDILESQGYNIDEAINGKEAIEKAVNPDKIYDLILMDIQMPEVNGIDAIKEIKKTQNIPIIVVSACAMPHEVELAKQAGCLDYITKPINIIEFISKIKNTLGCSR